MKSIEIRPIDPRSQGVAELIAASDAYATALYPAESNHMEPVDALVKPNVYFVGVFTDGGVTPVGCGAVKRMLDEAGSPYGEIKRMFVAPEARGLGAGKAILSTLEEHLRTQGIGLVRLETGVRNDEALVLYERCGYSRIGPFADYWDDPLSIFMEKRLRLVD